MSEDEAVESTEAEEVQDDETEENNAEQVDERRPYVHPEGTPVILDDSGKPQDVGDYIGVSPEYMNYANQYDKPILTDQERLQFTDQYDHLVGNADETDLPVGEDDGSAEVQNPEPADFPDDEADSDAVEVEDETVTPVEFKPAPAEEGFEF